MKHMLVLNMCGRDSSLFDSLAEQYNDEWQITYAKTDDEALGIVADKSIDVVTGLADSKVNEILNLFSKLKKVPSKASRLVLTNQVNEKRISNALDLVNSHAPIDISVDELYSKLNRSTMIADTIAADDFFKQNNIVDSLPSMPHIYQELIDMFNRDEASVKEVSNLIKKDPAMTAKLIQLVNSSFFGLRRVIVSAEDAAVMIGVEPIKALVLSEQIFRLFENRRVPKSYLNQLWNHSTLTAAFARCISRCENADRVLVDTAFTAGMLHDIGKLIMLECLPEEYLEYAPILTQDTYESMEVERLIYGTTHPNMGAHLLAKWGFADNLLEPIMFHHKPLWLHKNFSALHAVFAADCFYHEFYGQCDESARLGSLHVDCRTVLEKAHLWKEACHKLIT